MQPDSLSELPAVAHWLRHAEDTRRILDENYHDDDFEKVLNIAIQENVLVQIEHLRSLPCIARRIMTREIELHAWTYEIESGTIFIYDPTVEEFLPLIKTETGFELAGI